MKAQTLFDAKETDQLKNWYVVDDVVMGGRSSGQFGISKEGHAQFSGEVSLENNGGFSMVRYGMKPVTVTPESKIQIRLKGDGSRYQFRVKNKRSESHSYIWYFETSGDWQTIEFALDELHPSFRGRNLDLPNFSQDTLEELAFLIGNKKPQRFQLLIQRIELME